MMQQIKLFVGREDHTSELEDEVNAWIAESGAKVISIAGNISPQSVLPGSKDAGSAGLTNTGLTRRFAPSDILMIVTYEKA